MTDWPYYDDYVDLESIGPDLSQSYQDYKDGIRDYYPGLDLIKQQLSLFDWAGLTEEGYERLRSRYK